jgi:uncharacterized membrane protein YccC
VASRFERLVGVAIERARERGRKAVIRALQLTGAAVIAYVVADEIFPGSRPLLAPLTALLVVQVSLYSTLTTGLRRVASVIAGVVIALLLSMLVGFTWWSLGALIAGSILVGQLLRLGEQLLEVPISAMLVMSVGGAEGQAASRIAETLVGAAVGVVYTAVLPGRVPTDTAGSAVERYADDMAQVLSRMAEQVSEGLTLERAQRWLDDTRRLSGRVARADRALVEAEERRKFNVRALGTLDVVPSLRGGLDALEHSTVALRGLCRAVVDQLQSAGESTHVYSTDAREALAFLLRELAAAVEAFGNLLRAEAEGAGPFDDELAAALDTVREARARLTDLLMIDPHADIQLWELNGTVLANVERILREIDLEEHTRRRDRQRREWESRPAAVVAVDRLRTTSREVAQRPLRWRRRTTPPGDD